MDKKDLITIPSAKLQKIVRLTFDEDPKLRKKAAFALSKIDDPAAVFALIELSTDKDEEVKELAKKLIAKRPKEEGAESIEEMFTKKKENINEDKVKEKIDKLFVGVEKNKANRIKEKIYPVFMKKMMVKKIDIKEQEKQTTLITNIENKKQEADSILTTYMDALKDIEPMFVEDKKIEVINADLIEEEIEKIEEEKPEFIYKESDCFFNKFLTIMQKTKEFGKKELEREKKRILKNIENDLNLSIKMVTEKVRGKKIENINELVETKKNKRNINTDYLQITSIEEMTIKKGRKTQKVFIFKLKDNEQSNILFVIPFERGKGINVDDFIKVEKGVYKKFDELSCFALTITKAGKIHLIK